jgi:hypothetical protein
MKLSVCSAFQYHRGYPYQCWNQFLGFLCFFGMLGFGKEKPSLLLFPISRNNGEGGS